MARQRGSGTHGEAVKDIRHPLLGPLAFQYSAFAVDDRPDLSMVVYNPATPDDIKRIKSLLAETAIAAELNVEKPCRVRVVTGP